MPSRGGRQGAFLAPDQLIVSYGDRGAGVAQGTGADWFGPLDPLQPIAPPDVASRQWDFPTGYNLYARPRVDQPIGFAQLRGLAETYDLLRLIIETRKDQVARMAWSIKPRDETAGKARDPAVVAATTFFARPDGAHGFGDWLRILLEDLFVLDAPTLYLRRNRGGKLIALLPLDGATIKPVIDDWGRRPEPFVHNGTLVHPVAYQQILKGWPAVDYSARDLIYRPRNVRAHTAYGFSPVEQIVATVGIALRRQMSTLDYYTAGTIPDSLIGVPESWTPEQIAAYQTYWDAAIEGDLARRRKAKFVPGGVAKTFIQTKEPELKSDFDEWLARICCFAFSISPQALVKQMNRASAQTQKELAQEEGLWPVLNWVKGLIDEILAREFDAPQLEFAWSQDAQNDPAQQAEILSTYVKLGVLTINEARQQLGLAPLADAAANGPLALTATGYAPIGGAQTFSPSKSAFAKRLGGRPETYVARPAADPSVHKYSPDQPRVAAGQADGGQWTAEGAATAAGSTGGAAISAADRVTPQGFTIQHLPGGDPLDPKGSNKPLSADEQQNIANALAIVLNGGGRALQPHPYRNFPHNQSGAVMPSSMAGYTAYNVPGFGSDRGVHRLLIDRDTGAIYYTNNHYWSFYIIQLNPDSE